MQTQKLSTQTQKIFSKIKRIVAQAMATKAMEYRDHIADIAPMGITGDLEQSFYLTDLEESNGILHQSVQSDLEYAEYQDTEELRHMPGYGLDVTFKQMVDNNARKSLRRESNRPGEAEYSAGYRIAMEQDHYVTEAADFTGKAFEFIGGEEGIRKEIEKRIEKIMKK